MSFILDALKKSETERQRQGSAEFAGVPTSSRRRDGPPAWMWVVGILLLVNVAVLIGILVKPEASPTIAAPAASVPAQPPPLVDDFSDRVAAARDNAPPRDAPRQQASPVVTRALPEATATTFTDTAVLPTIHEVRANGAVTIPDLHVDIHVFSEIAEDRFVFINMNKHNEGSRLSEGPLVEEITPDGVVLSMNGTTFLLPRD